MAPKGHRAASTGLLRSHSRSSSTSKLGANLQFTQKDLPQPKHAEKPKKNGYNHDMHIKPAPPFPRAQSSQHIRSKEQLQPFVSKRAPTPHNTKSNGAKAKTGFSIASPGNDDEDDDWVSSESGAATPNQDDSDSDTESGTPVDHHNHLQVLERGSQASTHPEQNEAHLSRVATARPSDYDSVALVGRLPIPSPAPVPRTSMLPSIQTTQPHAEEHESEIQRVAPDIMIETRADIESPSRHHSSRPTSKRYASTRPPSTHSMSGRTDHVLRPHPLIRGQSFGHINHPLKPAPLAPLAVISDADSTGVSASPTSSLDAANHLSTSPLSSRTTVPSPSSSDIAASTQHRRTSVSSARSVATLPVQPTWKEPLRPLHDRTRTLSTLSSSSSSAALSSLVHLPTITRPPSPQAISFFPPVNPYANLEGIHPLLPAPYLHNHLTVLVRRTPIRESYDRVIRAKQSR